MLVIVDMVDSDAVATTAGGSALLVVDMRLSLSLLLWSSEISSGPRLWLLVRLLDLRPDGLRLPMNDQPHDEASFLASQAVSALGHHLVPLLALLLDLNIFILCVAF